MVEFESIQQAIEQLRKLEQRQAAFTHALGVMELDGAAYAPCESWEGRGITMGALSEAMYQLIADPKNEKLLSFLQTHNQELDEQQRREVEVVGKSYRQLNRIPQEEYVAYNILLNDSKAMWEKAKSAGDFSLFQPYLEKVVDYNRKFASYYNPELAPYDALLNEYEEGMTMEVLDEFFSQLRKTIVPLLEKIRAKKIEQYAFVNGHYPAERQRLLSAYLMDVLGLDRKYCAIAESEHPFTINYNNKDVRITTHYYEDNLLPSMYSVIHEGGHAVYELGIEDKYNYTALYGGVSMGIHESQSRFYENIIGRSQPFIQAIFPKLKDIFPDQLSGVDAHMFYRAVNHVDPSFIRIESDELCYCLHIMVRYEIEKQLIAGTLAVKDVPAEWNRLYREYLGVEVPNDSLGCLQDIHWSCGNIGYFPSYALGNAYGAQMLKTMERELGDIFEDVKHGDLSRVTGWLREHFHKFACLKKPGQLFAESCGTFDSSFYTEYLTEKFSKLYDL